MLPISTSCGLLDDWLDRREKKKIKTNCESTIAGILMGLAKAQDPQSIAAKIDSLKIFANQCNDRLGNSDERLPYQGLLNLIEMIDQSQK